MTNELEKRTSECMNVAMFVVELLSGGSEECMEGAARCHELCVGLVLVTRLLLYERRAYQDIIDHVGVPSQPPR